MAKKTLWIILIALFVLVIGGIVGGYFYLSNTKTTLTPSSDLAGQSGDVAPSGVPVVTTSSATSTNTLNPLVGSVPRLRKISATPVSGADIFSRKVGTTTVAIIRYIDRGTGNIFETATSSLDVKRITNTTIPKINEAYFGAGGDIAVLRYLNDQDTIETFIGKVSGTSTELTGNFIGEDAQSFALSPLKTRFFYTTTSDSGSAWFIADLTNTVRKTTQIFTSPLKGWLSSWPNENQLVITTKPTAQASGASYLLSTKGGALTKLVGPKNGLVVTPSPLVTNLIYSEGDGSTLTAGIHNVKTAQERTLSLPTVADKCVWTASEKTIYCGIPKAVPVGQYPDAWYQGTVSFNDTITSIDPTTLQSTTLIDPMSATGENIDATDLHLSADGAYLIFTNKKDLSLWGLRLN